MKTNCADLKHIALPMWGLVAACSMLIPFALIPFAAAQPVAPRIASAIAAGETVQLKNSQHPLAQPQLDAGRMPADARLNGITMNFSRSPQQEADLQALLAAQQNPASTLYHKWLTSDQFAARFGMADSDLAKAQTWLEEQGFSIDSIARSKNAIHFSGSARQVEQAFSTEMHYYKFNGAQHFAPSTALSVPSALASTVLSIKNLNDFRPRSHMAARKNMAPRKNFTGADNQVVFFAPADIATAYDISPLYNAGITGAGQSIAIVGQSSVQVSDLEAFQTNAGLAVKDPTQYLVPDSGDPTVEADGDESESDLDLEWSDAIAPGATIDFVYVGNNPAYGAFDSIQYAIDENIGTIISSSYGECETYLDNVTLETNLEQAATQGQTVMAAAGDDGSTDCFIGFGTGEPSEATQTALAVDYPASSAYVTGMGGTEINQANADYSTPGDGYWQSNPGNTDLVDSVLKYIPEVVWNDDDPTDGLSATGGGASALFSKPSWQTGVPGIPSDGKRDVPDLALYGSPNFPGYLFCSSDSSEWNTGQESSCTSGFEDSATGDLTAAGGTSFDAPIFSGMLALINQKQGYATGQGLINPTLYTLASNSATYASAFHDITSGNNDCTAGSAFCGSTTGGFSAGVGYDQVSGLGSVDANNLATDWPANTTPITLTPTTTTITASSTSPLVGVSDSFTIAVTSSSGTPAGTVTITVDDNAPVTETLASNGTYVYPTSFSTAGTHVILTEYAATSTYEGSSSSLNIVVTAPNSGKGTIALAASPSTLTVAQGSTGSETISVTPAGGYTGTVDLALSTTSSASFCYSSATAPISGTTAVQASITIDTDLNDGNCSSGSFRKVLGSHTAANKSGSAPDLLARASISLAGLLLAGVVGWRSRRLRFFSFLIALAIASFSLVACGGSVASNTSETAQGTYTITVTGTDSTTSTITSSTTFSLVVN